MCVRVEIVYWCDGTERAAPPDAAAARALAERCVRALLTCRFPGVAVSFRRRRRGREC